MEQRVSLRTKTQFYPTDEELKHFYLTMALIGNHYKYNPNYDEGTLLRRMYRELKGFNSELLRLHKQEPNNLAIYQILSFVQRFYSDMRKVR